MLELPLRGACLPLRRESFPLVQLELRRLRLRQVQRLLQCWKTSLIPWIWILGLTANDAAVLTSAEIMYNPFDRPPGEEIVEARSA